MGCHVGTHVDALAHVSQDGLASTAVLTMLSLPRPAGASSRWASTSCAPFVGRGVLLDVRLSLLGVDELRRPATRSLSSRSRRAHRERTGATTIAVTAMTRSSSAAGWGASRRRPGALSRCRQRCPRRRGRRRSPVAGGAGSVSLVGADTIAFEVRGAGSPVTRCLPVHGVLLVERRRSTSSRYWNLEGSWQRTAIRRVPVRAGAPERSSEPPAHRPVRIGHRVSVRRTTSAGLSLA